jgi:hypothetical protein
MVPDRTNTWQRRHSGPLRAIRQTTTVDKDGKRETKSKASKVLYPNPEVSRRHVIAMRGELFVALWKHCCYN